MGRVKHSSIVARFRSPGSEEAGDGGVDAQGDVILSGPSRQHRDDDDVEVQDEILAEVALAAPFVEVLVRRGDDADIDLDQLVRAKPLDHPFTDGGAVWAGGS